MKINSIGHVFETLPPFLGNRQAQPGDQFVVGLKVVPTPEQDEYQRFRERAFATFALDKAQEEVDKKLRETVRAKVAFIRGLIIDGINDDGRELSFDEFYAQAPPEIVSWVCRAVMSTTELSAAERKNFLPGSAGR